MEVAIGAALGGAVVVLGAIAAGVLLLMWKAWWMHPLWALVVVPIGLPQISYWHFAALNMFWTAFHGRRASRAKKDKDEESGVVGEFVAGLLWPVLAYYCVRWFVS